jgi:hypothetical protein
MVAMSISGAWPPAGQLFTVDELDRMPDDGRRYELLDAVLIVSPRPRVLHQEVAFQIAVEFREACPQQLRVRTGRNSRYSSSAQAAGTKKAAASREPPRSVPLSLSRLTSSRRASSKACCRRDQQAPAVVTIQASTRASSRQAS